MLLTIDIGNSGTKLGLFSGATLLEKQTYPTEDQSQLWTDLQKKFPAVTQIAACTVVPVAEPGIQAKPFWVSHSNNLPFSLQIENPQTFGTDRLAGLAGVADKPGNWLVIDMGTFLTIDGLTQKKEAIGGIIFPGLNSCHELYAKNSSTLPNVVLEKPKTFFGKNTKTAIQSGLINGYCFLVRGFLQKMADEMHADCQIIATGGGWQALQQHFPDVAYDPDLTLQGIRKIFELNV